MTQLAVHGPLDEGGLHDDVRTHPMRAQPGQPLRFRKRRRRYLERIEAAPQVEQQLRVEAGPDLSSEHEIRSLPGASRRVEIADEKRTQSHASALRIGEASHDQLLR